MKGKISKKYLKNLLYLPDNANVFTKQTIVIYDLATGLVAKGHVAEIA
jgi:hypothetical protein